MPWALIWPAYHDSIDLPQHAALDRLETLPVAGNVREFENLARRLAALYPKDTITAAVIAVPVTSGRLACGGLMPGRIRQDHLR